MKKRTKIIALTSSLLMFGSNHLLEAQNKKKNNIRFNDVVTNSTQETNEVETNRKLNELLGQFKIENTSNKINNDGFQARIVTLSGKPQKDLDGPTLSTLHRLFEALDQKFNNVPDDSKPLLDALVDVVNQKPSNEGLQNGEVKEGLRKFSAILKRLLTDSSNDSFDNLKDLLRKGFETAVKENVIDGKKWKSFDDWLQAVKRCLGLIP